MATDIAARGIDVDDLEFVINYEIPNISETYVHRIGRTGRAGAKGTAISFCDEHEIEFIMDIEKLIAKKIPVIEGHPFPLKAFYPGAKSTAPVAKTPPPSNNRRREWRKFPKKKSSVPA